VPEFFFLEALDKVVVLGLKATSLARTDVGSDFMVCMLRSTGEI